MEINTILPDDAIGAISKIEEMEIKLLKESLPKTATECVEFYRVGEKMLQKQLDGLREKKAEIYERYGRFSVTMTKEEYERYRKSL